jgi:secondary thiamine-phosphate synthase enzyme
MENMEEDTKEFIISTKEKYEVVDITEKVESIVAGSKKKEGMCLVYVPHATCAVIINENYDPNVSLDLLDALDKLVPEGKWRHDKVDNNGAAHIKASIIGPSETIPLKDGKLMLGRWQDIMVASFDGPKEVRVIVKIQ